MADAWTSDLLIPDELARRIVVEECGIDVQTIQPFGEGWDNRAFLVNHRLVFRFPRRRAAVPCLLAEIELLPYVRSDGVQVPKIQYSSKESALSGQPFVGYEILPGSPAGELGLSDDEKSRLAPFLARFLKQLHSTSIPDDLIRQFTKGQEWRIDIQGRVKKLEQTLASDVALFSGLDVDAREIIRLCSGIKIPKIQCLVHGDFYSLHYLVSNRSSLTSIIDWGDVHWGSPSLDLAVGFGFLPESALPAFEVEYGGLSDEIKIASAFRAFTHSAILFQYCSREKKVQLLDESKSTLERSGRWLLQLLK